MGILVIFVLLCYLWALKCCNATVCVHKKVWKQEAREEKERFAEVWLPESLTPICFIQPDIVVMGHFTSPVT